MAEKVSTQPATVGEEDLEQREQQELLDALKRATIGEYDIYSPLGRGGMATVFLALELSLNRPVAIKVISPSALSSTTIIERFWLEARTAASLSHPNVIPIYAVKSTGGLHYFVMKHIQGGSLDTVLKNEGRFSYNLVRTILTQVSSALAYAHRRGVVHRDIKPGNIMLDDDGYAVVMDFGIAKVRDVAALTASGAMVGTPFYMSPEQFTGEQLDGRTDQYSLGIVAYELLAGTRPFVGSTVAEVLRGHLMDRAPDIRDVRHDCPTALATLINRMLCKAPADRFPTMDAVVSQLEAMPRMDADKVREKIAAFARTASTSSPQITVPVSPTPLSRTSNAVVKPNSDQPEALTPRRSVLSPITARPVISVSIALAIVGVSIVIVNSMTSGQAAEGPQKLSASEVKSVPAAVVSAPIVAPAPAPAAKSPDESPKPTPTTVTHNTPPANGNHEKNLKKESSSKKETQEVEPPPRQVEPEPKISVIQPAPMPIPLDAVPFEPAPKPPPVFSIGSREAEAVLYIDGRTIGLLNRRIRTFRHDAGPVHVQLKAEDCLTYDTTFVLKQGDSTMIGWRAPTCNR